MLYLQHRGGAVVSFKPSFSLASLRLDFLDSGKFKRSVSRTTGGSET